MTAAAYEWHNYGKSTIGNRSDIERVPIEKLQAFYRKYYQPDNVVLIVAGKFEEAKALALVRKYFGAIPRPKRKLDNTYTEEPAQDGERTVILRRVGSVGSVGVAYHIPSAGHADWAALESLAGLLSQQPNGRLYKALVESRKASGANASAGNNHDPALFTASAQRRTGPARSRPRPPVANAGGAVGRSVSGGRSRESQAAQPPHARDVAVQQLCHGAASARRRRWAIGDCCSCSATASRPSPPTRSTAWRKHISRSPIARSACTSRRIGPSDWPSRRPRRWIRW